MSSSPPLRIYSWNVNGLRSCSQKGFYDWLETCEGTVVGMQEVRAQESQLDSPLFNPKTWHRNIHSAQRLGYSGVGYYSRRKADAVETSLGLKKFDDEGRLQLIRFGKLLIANVYFPNGNGKNRDNSRVAYKLEFYRKLFNRLRKEEKETPNILVMGDFNTAHTEIDLARPKENRKTSGFLPEECKELDRWIQTGWVDTFRLFEPNPGHYSWWSQRSGARQRNVGWRIDYMLASNSLVPLVKSANIHPQVKGSDHCPISVDLDAASFAS